VQGFHPNISCKECRCIHAGVFMPAYFFVYTLSKLTHTYIYCVLIAYPEMSRILMFRSDAFSRFIFGKRVFKKGC